MLRGLRSEGYKGMGIQNYGNSPTQRYLQLSMELEQLLSSRLRFIARSRICYIKSAKLNPATKYHWWRRLTVQCRFVTSKHAHGVGFICKVHVFLW